MLRLRLQERARRQLEAIRAQRARLQQVQDRQGSAARQPIAMAGHAADRQGGAAPERALLSRKELRGTESHVSRQVYDQVASSRSRLSQRLSAANQHIRHLQTAAERQADSVAAVHSTLVRIQSEFLSLSRQADAAAASANFNVDKADTTERVQRLARRMQQLQQTLAAHAQQLSDVTLQRVPVVWYGLGQEVRVMGSFDQWTQGVLLSAEEIMDGTFNRFVGELRLTPGRYEIKFLVDGQWRLASDWPTTTGRGEVNNLLVVQ